MGNGPAKAVPAAHGITVEGKRALLGAMLVGRGGSWKALLEQYRMKWRWVHIDEDFRSRIVQRPRR